MFAIPPLRSAWENMPRTLYRHFPTREALAAAVYGDEVTALCARARESTRPAGERLESFILAFVDYMVEHAALAKTLAAVVDDAAQAAGGDQVERVLVDLMAAAAADRATRDDVTPGAVLIVLHGIGASINRPQWVTESRAVAALLVSSLKPPVRSRE